MVLEVDYRSFIVAVKAKYSASPSQYLMCVYIVVVIIVSEEAKELTSKWSCSDPPFNPDLAGN